MYWMLKDKEFYLQVLQILRDRYISEQTVWSFALYHNLSEEQIREYLQLTKPYEFVNQLGYFFNSKLLSIDSSTVHNFQHCDYFPMLNNRAHAVGDADTKTILNKTLRTHYEQFLQILSEKISINEVDKLELVYYLHLQDRNQKAIELFK